MTVAIARVRPIYLMSADLHVVNRTYVVTVTEFVHMHIILTTLGATLGLQCFDAVGWAAGRASNP